LSSGGLEKERRFSDLLYLQSLVGSFTVAHQFMHSCPSIYSQLLVDLFAVASRFSHSRSSNHSFTAARRIHRIARQFIQGRSSIYSQSLVGSPRFIHSHSSHSQSLARKHAEQKGSTSPFDREKSQGWPHIWTRLNLLYGRQTQILESQLRERDEPQPSHPSTSLNYFRDTSRLHQYIYPSPFPREACDGEKIPPDTSDSSRGAKPRDKEPGPASTHSQAVDMDMRNPIAYWVAPG
jgi:hypothetical protein